MTVEVHCPRCGCHSGTVKVDHDDEEEPLPITLHVTRNYGNVSEEGYHFNIVEYHCDYCNIAFYCEEVTDVSTDG